MTKIAQLQAEPLDIQLREPFGIAGGAQQHARNVLVRLTLSDNTVGIGEAAPFPAVNGETQQQVLDAFAEAKAIVEQQDALDWRALARRLAQALPAVPSLRCAVETALLDALCRRRGLSLWRFCGAAQRDLVSDITIPTGSVERARDAARRATEAGFEMLKVKVGEPNGPDEVARLTAIVEAAPDCRLILDANAALSPDEAIALVRNLPDGVRARLVLFEQPTAADRPEDLETVQSTLNVAVAADESARSLADVKHIARTQSAAMINIKITKTGIAEALDMIHVAKASGLGLMIGGMVESELCMTASACIAAGSGGFSVVDLDTPLFMLESPVKGGLMRRGARISVGHIGSGLGVEVEANTA